MLRLRGVPINCGALELPAQIPGVGDDVTFATAAAVDAYSTMDDIADDTIGNLELCELCQDPSGNGGQ